MAGADRVTLRFPGFPDRVLRFATCETGDEDGDGVCSEADNCRAAANPDQSDADRDGYGEACDGDYDNDGVVGVADVRAILTALGTARGKPGYREALDADASAAIDAPDLFFQLASQGQAPGPSGLACAGLPPCPAD